jgi:DNA processing protein
MPCPDVRPVVGGRHMTGGEGRPSWWTPRVGTREELHSLAATPGPMPAAVATRLAEGRDPASLLRAHSPDPADVAAQLNALGLRLLLAGDQGWPLAANPPDPPCAWLFVSGPAPPGAAASVAVVGGRRASPLRRAAARSIGAGLARAGWCVVSGGAAGVDAAAHAGALDAGGRTVVVLGCGLDVPYPRANTGLFARVRAAGGTLVSEHPLGTQPRAANFLPRNRLIAALSAAVVVVEAAEDSGSLSTARAAGSRGAGHILVLPGAPWDPGAAGCNQLIRDGATLVRSLTDILEELATTPVGPRLDVVTGPGPGGASEADPDRIVGPASATGCWFSPGAGSPTGPVPASGQATGSGSGSGPRSGLANSPGPGLATGPGRFVPAQAWAGLDPSARAVLTVLIDGQLLTPGRLATATDLPPADLENALLDLELAGLIRRTAGGVQAITLPSTRALPADPADSGQVARDPGPRGPPGTG